MVPLFLLAHMSHHLLTALPPPLLPFIRDDFSLSYTQAGFLLSAFSIVYGVSQLPAGWLADRIGARMLITIGICGVALAGCLVGLSQTYLMAIFFMVLMGVVGGGYHPAAPPLLAASVDLEKRGRAFGFHSIGGGVSHFLAPLLAGGIASAWGWRSPFFALALPTLLFGIALYVLLGKYTTTKETAPVKKEGHTEASTSSNEWRWLIPFMVLSAITPSLTLSVASFVPLWLVDYFGTSKETAAFSLALLRSSGLGIGLLGGDLADRFGGVVVTVVVSFIAGLCIFLLNVVPYGIAVGAVLVIMGMTNYIRMPAAESHIVSHVSPHHRSTIFGIYYFLGVESAGLLNPLIGYLIDQFGFNTTFSIAALTLVTVTLVCTILLWRSRDRPYSN
ncbi:MFS transporter [Chloroflexota bacterium]